VSETGTTATFTVALQAAPSSNVTIPVSSSDTTEATVSPASLVFTSSNWSTPQTVTVTGVNDASADGTQNFTIVLGAATSADTAYSGYNPADVTGSTADNDVAGITVTPTTSITITEGGSKATFTLVLNTAPSANVTIAVSSSNTAAATVSPSSVTFTTTNYGTAQTVSVTPVNDTVGDGNKTFNVVLGAATSTDTGYSGLNPADISGLTLDNDTAGVTLTVAATPVVGGYQTCIQSTLGSVKCWGQNTDGQLGLGSTTNRGDGASEMGTNLPAVSLGTGRTSLAIGPGSYHTCALLDNRQVKCWGSNFAGQLGLGDTNNRGDAASEMGDSLPAVSLGTGRTAKAIEAGGYHSCAILDNSQVKCWGQNTYGQLGIGDTAHRGDAASEMGDSLPTVSLGTGRTATQLGAGAFYTCALLDNAQVKCWGSNTYGQLGLGDTSTRGDAGSEMGDSLPTVSLGAGRSATAIAVGSYHACALLDNSRVKCWGYNVSGQLGLGDTSNRGDGASEMGDSLPLIDLGSGRTVLTLAAGWRNTCAVLDNYTAKCWGYNTYGDLGLGDTAHRGDGASEMGDNLTAISIGTSRTFRTVSSGFNYSCARLDDGRSKCWGQNTYGGLGLGDTSARGDGAGEMGDSLSFLDWVP
jgi:alpha-tubulin suppressor-like RCC1 family protein